MNSQDAETVMAVAAEAVGLNAEGAVLIRDGSNVMYRLGGDVVARVGGEGQEASAEREVRVSQWLTSSGLSVTRAMSDLRQPVVVDRRPVTWWELIPSHRPGTPAELTTILRRLHRLPIPESIGLPAFDPFARIEQRVAGTSILSEEDRLWLDQHITDLRVRYSRVRASMANCVIHGDAWQGNVATPECGDPILLDLESVAIGPVDWDLVQIAVDHTDFSRLTPAEYKSFVDAYGGYDVTTNPTYRLFADIQEVRWTCFALSKASLSPDAAREARHRIACLRGGVPLPWSWTAL